MPCRLGAEPCMPDPLPRCCRHPHCDISITLQNYKKILIYASISAIIFILLIKYFFSLIHNILWHQIVYKSYNSKSRMNVIFFICLQNPVLSYRITALNPTAAMYDSGFISTTEVLSRTAQKTLPVTWKSIARGNENHCPWQCKTLPIVLQGDGQRNLG